MGIVAQRVFNPLYIYLDIAFLVFLCIFLAVNKKFLTLTFGILGGLLYMVVDYGIFHLLLGTRSIQGGNLFWVLLWMSMSYGITNFVWIWLWISKDKRLFEWSCIILVWWIGAPLIANTFGLKLTPIKIQRTTNSYHGYMAIILVLSYLGLCIYNIRQKEKEKRFNILWLLLIGVLVQFGWEFSLLIGGIRSAEIASFGQKIITLIVNSLVETNLGLPLIYIIFLSITRLVNEDFSKRKNKLSFMDCLKENNLKKVRETEKEKCVSKDVNSN